MEQFDELESVLKRIKKKINMDTFNGTTWYGELKEDSLPGLNMLSEDLDSRYELTTVNGKRIFRFFNLASDKSLRLISTARKYGIVVTTEDPTSEFISESIKAIQNNSLQRLEALPSTSRPHNIKIAIGNLPDKRRREEV